MLRASPESVKKRMHRQFCFTPLISNRLRLAVILLVLAWINSSYGHAKGANEHYGDWYNVLGVCDENSKKALKPVLSLLQTEIIDAEANNSSITPLREKLKRKWNLSFTGKNHRVLFHWGFNQDIKQYRPLLDEINRQFAANEPFFRQKQRELRDSGNFDDFLARQKAEVLDCINAERQRRNGLLIAETQKCAGLFGQPARGFATILWDIHILSDYGPESTVLSGLLDTTGLRKDLILYGLERMRFERSDIKPLCDLLYEAERNEPRLAAARMYEALKMHLPELLRKRWGQTFGASGITIVGGSR